MIILPRAAVSILMVAHLASESSHDIMRKSVLVAAVYSPRGPLRRVGHRSQRQRLSASSRGGFRISLRKRCAGGIPPLDRLYDFRDAAGLGDTKENARIAGVLMVSVDLKSGFALASRDPDSREAEAQQA